MRRRRSLRRVHAAIVLFIAATLLASCGSDGGNADIVMSSVARQTPTTASGRPVASALDTFSGELFTQLAKTIDGNIVLSPYSVAVALAMTRAGAAGETKQQLDRVLHLTGIDADSGFNALDQALATRTGEVIGQDGKKLSVVLATANALWPQVGYPFATPFLDHLAANYGAGLHVVDYQREVERSRRTINAWVSDHTAKKIPELIPKDALDSLTRLVLTNAVYLKASWAEPFETSATADGAFTRLDRSAVTASFMHQTESLGYAKGAGWQLVELPYAGGKLAMDVIVPDAGQFAAVTQTLQRGTASFFEHVERQSVQLGLPKFRFRTQADLVDTIAALGLTDLFDPDRADLSAITAAEKLYVSGVLHEAFIDVNEKGTEAAAATAIVIRASAAPGGPVPLTVDRPFVIVLRDLETNAVLFLGRVLDPTA
jgi:serpin B